MRHNTFCRADHGLGISTGQNLICHHADGVSDQNTGDPVAQQIDDARAISAGYFRQL